MGILPVISSHKQKQSTARPWAVTEGNALGARKHWFNQRLLKFNSAESGQYPCHGSVMDLSGCCLARAYPAASNKQIRSDHEHYFFRANADDPGYRAGCDVAYPDGYAFRQLIAGGDIAATLGMLTKPRTVSA